MKSDSVVHGPRAARLHRHPPSASTVKSALEMACPQAVFSARMEHLKIKSELTPKAFGVDSPLSLNTRNRVFSPNP
jgi:hypothetical protein